MNAGECYHRIRISRSTGDRKLNFMFRGRLKGFVEEVTCEICPGRGGVIFISGVLA